MDGPLEAEVEAIRVGVLEVRAERPDVEGGQGHAGGEGSDPVGVAGIEGRTDGDPVGCCFGGGEVLGTRPATIGGEDLVEEHRRGGADIAAQAATDDRLALIGGGGPGEGEAGGELAVVGDLGGHRHGGGKPVAHVQDRVVGVLLLVPAKAEPNLEGIGGAPVGLDEGGFLLHGGAEEARLGDGAAEAEVLPVVGPGTRAEIGDVAEGVDAAPVAGEELGDVHGVVVETRLHLQRGRDVAEVLLELGPLSVVGAIEGVGAVVADVADAHFGDGGVGRPGHVVLRVVHAGFIHPVGVDHPVPLHHEGVGGDDVRGEVLVGGGDAGADIAVELGVVHAELQGLVRGDVPVDAGKHGVGVGLAGVGTGLGKEGRVIGMPGEGRVQGVETSRGVGATPSHVVGGLLALGVIGHEVEELVLDQGAADAEAELLLAEVAHGIDTRGTRGLAQGRTRLDPQLGTGVVEEAAAGLVGAVLRDGVHIAAAHAAELGAGAVGDHLILADGFDGDRERGLAFRRTDGAAEEGLVVVAAVNVDGGVHTALAGDGEVAAAAVHHHLGRQGGEVGEGAVEDGQAGQVVRGDDGRGAGALAVHLGGGGGDHFHHRAGLGRELDGQGGGITEVQVQLDVAGGLEAGLGDGHDIGAHGQQGGHVAAFGAGLQRAGQAGLLVADDDGGAGHGAALGIQHAATQLSGDALGHEGGRCHQQGRKG